MSGTTGVRTTERSEAAPRVIAIGDIHGCARALGALLEAIQPRPEDVLVPLGDVIDRGPDSRRVIELLLALRERCRLEPILGNHEEMLLDVVLRGKRPHAWVQCGGAATLDSYGFDGSLRVIPEPHVEFLRTFHDAWETPTHFFVHANYDERLPLARQAARSLRWTSLLEYVPGPHFSGKTAIVGHTPDYGGEVLSLRHLKCLDTFCYGDGWLTAFDTVGGRIWQANEQGELRACRR